MIVAISTGPITHLDHLAPLCAVGNFPLIVTEESHLKMGRHFYPMIDIQYVPLSDCTLNFLAKNFSTIVTCGKFWAVEIGPVIQQLYGKKISFLFAPHGFSDKEKLLNRPIQQEKEFVYHNHKKRKEAIEIGNLRKWFYHQYQDHFDELAKPSFQTDKKVVLYAPTWESKATPTSFFSSTSMVIDQLSSSYHLLIKLHPLLEENNPAAYYRILGKYESNVEFILDFPPVYPFLHKTDIYLGDYSSVGYDFLSYNRPMFFINSGGDLNSCGKPFEGSVEDQQLELSDMRKDIYKQTFGKCNPEKIKSWLVS